MSNNKVMRVLTVRNVPSEVDEAISSQAKALGKSKSDFVQEHLSAMFGDLISNFCRTNGWVALSDQEVAKMIDAKLSDYWFEAAQTLAENRAYCRRLCRISVGKSEKVGLPIF